MKSVQSATVRRAKSRRAGVRLSGLVVVAALTISLVVPLAGHKCGCCSLLHSLVSSSSASSCPCGDSATDVGAASRTACQQDADGGCTCTPAALPASWHRQSTAACAGACCETEAVPLQNSAAAISCASCTCHLVAFSEDSSAKLCCMLTGADGAPASEAIAYAPATSAKVMASEAQTSPLSVTLRVRDRSPPHLA